ncbi:mRNA 3'-end-processing protein rna14 [Marasmius tenuissimus]|nr:mRNA 3'-end-processing protein rna14 [Marasmius tenuissimus]
MDNVYLEVEPFDETPLSQNSDEQQLAEFQSLQQHLQEDPFDTASWKSLVASARESGNTENVRAAYEDLLKQYPHSTSAQIGYIDHFLHDLNAFDEIKALFTRFLKGSCSVDLYRFYATYIRRINTDSRDKQHIRQAYDFALNVVGNDKDSGDIWYDYLVFLKSGQTNSTWEKQQKDDMIRKVLHRAVQIPLINVEELWHELESFENGLSRITAKKLMQDLSPAYIQAKSVLRELIKHTNSLYPSATPLRSGEIPDLFLPMKPSFSAQERQMVGKWKAYLKWEEGNPLELEAKDKGTLISRVQSAYRKAIIKMRFYPEIWFMAYNWMTSVGKSDEAFATLKAGLEANPDSYVLTFELAEALEIKKEYGEVRKLYFNFLVTLRAELVALDDAEKARVAAEAASKDDGDESDQNQQMQPTEPSSSQGSNTTGTSKEFEEQRKEYGLAYIMFMRFARRAEGVAAFRAIFLQARRDVFTPWQVHEAGAMTEYHCNGDKDVALRIFERGMTIFGKDRDYVLGYLNFLITVDDRDNARTFFENVISTFEPSDARLLWERWTRYEYQYGDLESVQNLERRLVSVYPNEPPIKLFAQRHMYLDTDAIASRDLGLSLAKKEISPANSLESVIGEPSRNAKRRITGDSNEGGGRTREDRDYTGNKRQRASSPQYSNRRRSLERASRRGVGDREKAKGRESEPARERGKEKEERLILSAEVAWFLTQLPDQQTFSGPIFRTEDLMNLLRGVIIPSSTGIGAAGSSDK